jgi:hypothetical protein
LQHAYFQTLICSITSIWYFTLSFIPNVTFFFLIIQSAGRQIMFNNYSRFSVPESTAPSLRSALSVITTA